ncbi:hypothetical protein L218DRAFT_945593 [Marasmius fiardii PR-910]|nr:hypothetical protein L218DRAFT_945593 [Marasmius fiardii PR-910]
MQGLGNKTSRKEPKLGSSSLRQLNCLIFHDHPLRSLPDKVQTKAKPYVNGLAFIEKAPTNVELVGIVPVTQSLLAVENPGKGNKLFTTSEATVQRPKVCKEQRRPIWKRRGYFVLGVFSVTIPREDSEVEYSKTGVVIARDVNGESRSYSLVVVTGKGLKPLGLEGGCSKLHWG